MSVKTPSSAAEYMKSRYSTPDQRWVNRTEIRLVQRILSEIDRGFGRILDIPCGYGRFHFALAERAMLVVSADISREMLLLAPNKFGIKCDIRALPFRDSSFDLVFVMRLFQHLDTKSKKEALYELRRVTRRWTLLSFYRTSVIHKIERKITGRPPNIGMISVIRFKEMAKEVGFQIERLVPLFNFHAQTLALLRIP